MSKGKMSAKNTRELINFVKLNPALWKKNSSGYHKNTEKEIAWRAIGKSCKSGNMTGPEAKARWKSLRDKFCKEYKKTRESQPSSSGAGAAALGDIYVSEWEYYQDLLFLRDQITPKSTTSNMEISEGSGGSIKSEGNAEAKSRGNKEQDGDSFELPSWFQVPQIQHLINTGDEKEPSQESTGASGNTDDEFGDSYKDDSDSDDGTDVVMKEPGPKKFDIERKVPASDKCKKRKIEDDLTKELANMARVTTKAMRNITVDVQSQDSKSARPSPRDSFDEEIEPIMNMMKYSLRFVNENIRVECATEMLQVVVVFKNRE